MDSDAFKAEKRRAILRYAFDDSVRTVVAWFVPQLFLLTNSWARHRSFIIAMIVFGAVVIAGTTSSLPTVAMPSLSSEHPTVWTPLRPFPYIAVYLALWFLTFALIGGMPT